MNLEELAKFYSTKNQASLERMASSALNSLDEKKSRLEYEQKLKKMFENGISVEELEKQENDRNNSRK